MSKAFSCSNISAYNSIEQGEEKIPGFEDKKVFLLDADTIIIENIDNVFELSSPAATFHNYWGKHSKKNSKIINYYKDDKIAYINEIIQSLYFNGSVITASAVLLSPNKNDYDSIKICLKKQ